MTKHISILLFSFLIISSSFAQKKYKALMNDNSVNFYEVCNATEAYFQSKSKGKGSGWKGYQRWKAANEYKYFPSGNRKSIDPFFVEHAFQEFNNNSLAISYPNGWKELGPLYVDSITGQYSVGLGRVEAVYVDPADSLKIYMGSRSGGFWRTSNGGQNWQCTTDTLFASGVNTIGVSPTNADSVLINVRNANNANSHGIYRSVDGGISWSVTNFNPTTLGFGGLGSSFKIFKIAYHPHIANLIFVGTSKGVFKSTNNLQTWTQLMPGADITDIAFHPGNDSIIYIYDSYYYSYNRNKVFVSANLGGSYSSTNITGNSNKSGWLSVSNACNSCVYFASTNGVWKSVDNGASFTFMSNPNESCLGFAVNDQDTANMIYGYVDIHASMDGGQNFNRVTRWSLGNTNGAGSGHQNSFNTSTDYVHADLHPATCVNGTFYVGTDGFLCRGDSGGINWEILNQGTGIRENYKLGISQSNHYRSISGSQDNGTSIKHQNTWVEFYGADGMEAIIHPLNDDIMIGSVQYGNRKRTLDGGQSLSGVSPTHSTDGYWEAPIAYNPTNQMQIFDFRDSVYVSDDFGSTWSVRGVATGLSGKIKRAAIAENNSDIIVVANNQLIYKSTDGGYTFNSIKNNLPNYTIEDIAFDPNNDDRIIVVYARYQNDNSKVFITNNGGQSWTNITHNLGNMPVHTVVIDHTQAANIYVGAEIGVYTKPMNSNNWVLYNQGLPNTNVQELEINYGSNSIKAATWGRGLWEYSLVGRSNYPSILITSITNPPTENSPIQGIDQFVTSVISYSGTLSNVFVKWGKDTLDLSNTIAMTNTQDSTWLSNSAIPNFADGSNIFFKVYAVGSAGDTSETYRFMYQVQAFKYCIASGHNNGGYNLHIPEVSIANIINPSANTLYKYYSDSVVYLYRDSTYSITVKGSNTWGSNDYGAWIDFNRNAMFDDNENLNLVETAGDVATASFTVPSTAVISDTVRLRTRLSYWGSQSEPCGITLGEVEDYPVLIKTIDNIAPVPDSISLANYSEECSATPPIPTATDNIMGTIYGVSNLPLPITIIGATGIVWTFTDANGNSAQQSQNIIVTPVDTSVSKLGITITAIANNYSYQWVDCNNSYSLITGAINQSYTATANGNYAVIISGNSCSDTSSCHAINSIGINESLTKSLIELYPNPTSGIITILHSDKSNLVLEVLDVSGRIILTKELKNGKSKIDISNNAGGIYIFRFRDNDGVYYLKVIKE